jgi:lipopolysaccharide/colanic/teichoic acid biosynthesis glycosyltransferase
MMLKRCVDFIVSAVGLTVLSPVFVVVAAAICVDSQGPVFFRQERLGRGCARFRIFKIRSMVVDADRRGGKLTVGGDARVTRVGAFLRRHKIDELPQLINVLRGEMSLVGPRPEVADYAMLFPAEFNRILQVRPGITHRVTVLFRNEEELLASVADPSEAYVNKIMPAKMSLYIDAMPQQNVFDDVRTIVETIFQVGQTLTAEDLGFSVPAVGNIITAPLAAPIPMRRPVSVSPATADIHPLRRVRQTVA